MSSDDIDVKKRAEKAALIHVGASFLKVPQAMRAAGFSDGDSQNPTLQQRVRRIIKDKLENENMSQALGVVRIRPNPSPVSDFSSNTDDEGRLQSLQNNTITLGDTAVGRKQVLFEQQMVAASITMSEDQWNRCVEMRKRKLEFEEVGREYEMATAGSLKMGEQVMEEHEVGAL